MADNDDDKGFVVKDKRLFDEGGETRSEVPKANDEKEPERKPDIEEEDVKQSEETEEEKNYQLPEINFHNFILSLYTSVIFNLGELVDPVSKKQEKNLQAAKQTIDILGMLKEKTEGNLDNSEKELLDGVLSESRMRYVKESEKL